jgi:glucose-6-phosphate 1-dehydrogenase
MQFGLKSPGTGYNVKQVLMDFKYSELANTYIPSAYERLLLDAMQGDSALFIRSDAVEATWKFIDPLLRHLQNNKDFKLYGYPSCTWGPEEANQLIPEGWTEYPAYCSIEEEPKFTVLK